VIVPITYYPYGAVKDPDFSHANQGILNKIIYPTGGSSILEFEPNIYNNGQGVQYVKDTYHLNPVAFRNDTNTNNTFSVSNSFTINIAQMAHIYTSRIPKDVAGYPSGRLPTDPTKDFTADVIISGPVSGSFKINYNSDNAGRVDSLYLTPGSYTIQAQCDDKENSVSGSIAYVYQTNQVIEGNPGPGIRIKRITNYTDFLAAGTPSSVKEYVYKDSLGLSTGVLLNIPDYGGKAYTEIQPVSGGYTGPTSRQYLAYNSANGNGLSASQPMYYKTVYEKQVNGSDYLLSRHDFEGMSVSLSNGVEIFEKIKTDFKKTGAVYNKVARKEYHYTTIVDTSFFAIKPFNSQASLPYWFNRVYTYDNYYYDMGFNRLDYEKETSYFSGSDTLVTVKSYSYDAKPYNPIRITATDSKGYTVIEKNKYPENYTSSIGYPFTARYISSPVIEKQSWLKRSATDSVLTNAAITSYDGTLIKPLVLYGFNSLAPVTSLNQETKNASGQYLNLISNSTGFEQRVMNTYDYTSGNLVSQDMTGSDGASQVSYLWGYHNNYPIAQVKNAVVSSVAYTSFEDDDTSWPYTAGSVVTTDARTGVKSYNGTMTKSGLPSGNYTVSLWAKGSGTVIVGGVAKTITAAWAVYDWQLSGVTSVTVNSNGNKIDEVRLLPAGSMMNTYTYDPEVGVLSITDTKGLSQFFEYDDMKRLLNIRDQDGNVLKSYDYNYAIPPPIWVDNGVYQCVQGTSGNTGEQLKQQRDNNPASPTYNQTQWVSIGTNTSSCPIPVVIYVEMFWGNSTVTNGNTYRPFIFKAFSDANGTVPINVPVNLVVNYSQTTVYTYYDGRPNSTSTGAGSVTIVAGTNQVSTSSVETSGCQGVGTKQVCLTNNLSLQPGDGYQTIVIDP
jgi:hypothetical protein